MSLCAVVCKECNRTNGVKVLTAVIEILALQVDLGGEKKVARKRCSKFWVMFITLDTTGFLVAGAGSISLPLGLVLLAFMCFVRPLLAQGILFSRSTESMSCRLLTKRGAELCVCMS